MAMAPPFIRASVRDMSGYTPGEQPALGDRVVKLNTNENPYGPSPRVLAAIRAEVPDADVRAEGPELMFAAELDEKPLHALFPNVERTALASGTKATIAFYRPGH